MWSLSSVKPTGGNRVALLCEVRQMKHVTWPDDIDVRVFEITTTNAEKVAKSMKAGTVDCVVVAQKMPNNHITRGLPRDIVPVWVWIKNIHSLRNRLPVMLGFDHAPIRVPAGALVAGAMAAASQSPETDAPPVDLADKPLYAARDLVVDLISCSEQELLSALDVFHDGSLPPDRLYSFNEAAQIEAIVSQRRAEHPQSPSPTDGVIQSRYCGSSGERVLLTKQEAAARKKACPSCAQTMRIRPAEGYATLPRHLRPELATRSVTSVPHASTVHVETSNRNVTVDRVPARAASDRLVVGGVELPIESSPCSYRGIRAAFVEVTPEMAETWLAHSAPNRNKREAHVEKLVRAMDAEEWLLTHQGIAFSTEDACIDGQHRLDAVVRYGRPVPMMVTWGLAPEVIHVTDTGQTRPVSDVLAIMGEPSARTKSAIFRSFAVLIGAPDNKWSVQEHTRFLDYAREPVDWAMDAFSGHRKGTFKAPVIAPCMLVRASHPKEVELFVAKLVGREEAMTSDPAIKLKIALQQRAGDGQRMDVARYVLGALSVAVSGAESKMIRPYSIKMARQRWVKGWIAKYGDWPFGFNSAADVEAEE